MERSLEKRIEIGALTHRGAVRVSNEDAISIGGQILVGDMENPIIQELDPSLSLIMIADGMGGHTHGSLASRSALQSLIEGVGASTDPVALRQALSAANDGLYDIMAQRPEARGMGTTIVGAMFNESGMTHFNVGDSRAYRHCRGELVRLSYDDVPLGTAGPSLRRMSQAITQSLGGRTIRSRISPHLGSAPPLQHGESVLLCSDGLSDMVGERELSRTLDEISGLQERAVRLFELAMLGGGRDNISIVIAQPLQQGSAFS